VTRIHGCDLSPSSDNLAGLPIVTEMTDNGDGTYTADYIVSADGSVTVSVELVETGILVEYFTNRSISGIPEITRIENVSLDY
jgi:hypothetical protein